MNELIAGLVLFCTIFFGWSVARKTGFFSPASIYVWFLNVDLALFLLIVFARLEKTNYTFTAMPWPSFATVLFPTMMIYVVLILAGWLSVFRLRKQKTSVQMNFKTGVVFPYFVRRNFFLILILFLLLILYMEVYHFLDIDRAILWQNQKYLTIANPNSAGIETVMGRLIHFLLRPLGLLLVSAGTFFWVRHRQRTAALFFLLSIYPFLFALAENSRWAPLYIAGMLAVILIFGEIKRYYFSLVFFGSLGFLVFLKVLVGRNTPYQGLGGTVEVLRIIFSDFQLGRWTAGFFLNIFAGAQSLANALLIGPQYPDVYKLLSFSPTISALDHFDKIVNIYVVRITPVVPMNTYSEALFFGVPYFLFLLVILIAWLRTMTRLSFRRDTIGTAFMVFSYWAIFYLSQYPVRNSMRLIYLSLLIGVLVNGILSTKARIRAGGISHLVSYNETKGGT